MGYVLYMEEIVLIFVDSWQAEQERIQANLKKKEDLKEQLAKEKKESEKSDRR